MLSTVNQNKMHSQRFIMLVDDNHIFSELKKAYQCQNFDYIINLTNYNNKGLNSSENQCEYLETIFNNNMISFNNQTQQEIQEDLQQREKRLKSVLINKNNIHWLSDIKENYTKYSEASIFVLDLTLQQYGIYADKIDFLENQDKLVFIQVDSYLNKQELLHNFNVNKFAIEINNYQHPFNVLKIINRKTQIETLIHLYISEITQNSLDYNWIKTHIVFWFSQITKIYPAKANKLIKTQNFSKLLKYINFFLDSSMILFNQIQFQYKQETDQQRFNQLYEKVQKLSNTNPIVQNQSKDFYNKQIDFDHSYDKFQDLYNNNKIQKQENKIKALQNKHQGNMKNLVEKQINLVQQFLNIQNQEEESAKQRVTMNQLKNNDYLRLINSNPMFYHLFKHESKQVENQEPGKLLKKKQQRSKNKKRNKGIQCDLFQKQKDKNPVQKIQKIKKGKQKVLQNQATIQQTLNLKQKKLKKAIKKIKQEIIESEGQEMIQDSQESQVQEIIDLD